MLSTFSKDKLSARKGWWKQFPTFGQEDVFVQPLSRALGLSCAESITTPGAFSVRAHLCCTSLHSLSWPWLRSLSLPCGFLWVIISSPTCKLTDTCWGTGKRLLEIQLTACTRAVCDCTCRQVCAWHQQLQNFMGQANNRESTGNQDFQDSKY